MSRLGKRLLFGSLLVAVLAAGLWIDRSRAQAASPPLAAPLLVALFTLPAVNELVTILALAAMPLPRRGMLVVTAVTLFGKTAFAWLDQRYATARGGEWFVALLALELVLVAAWLLRDRDLASGARRSAAAVLVVALVAMLATMVDVSYQWGTDVLFALVLTAKAGDSGAYLVGRSLGRHKLIEHVSPKKTVEGAVGGFVASLLVGVWLLGHCFGHGRWSNAAILGISALVNVAGQVGDLFESLWKRAAGVKDSGHLLPEFGGALDVVDSLFLAMPAGGALLAALAH